MFGKNKIGGKVLVAGVLLGSAFAMFFAPQKGEILREKIAKEREQGHEGVHAVSRGVLAFGKELSRLAQNKVNEKMQIQKEHNPFTITKIHNYGNVA